MNRYIKSEKRSTNNDFVCFIGSNANNFCLVVGTPSYDYECNLSIGCQQKTKTTRSLQGSIIDREH